jgi:hypothetical protein
MRKERMFPMIFLVMFLVAVVALPQGFAKGTKSFGNRPVPPLPVHHQASIATHQSVNGLLVLSNSLPSSHQDLLEFTDDSGIAAFATPLLNM